MRLSYVVSFYEKSSQRWLRTSAHRHPREKMHGIR
jgi:hypothetical protein